MSVKVMTMVFDRYPVGGGEMMLALALADHAHDDGTHVFPYVDHLMTKTRQSRRTVQYQLRKMEESGWLILVNSGNGGRNQARGYVISPDWVNGGEVTPPEKKGAEIAPPKKGATDDIKGAIHDAKGATDDTKGCNPLHPHITVIEPSITVNESSSPAKLTLPDWLPVDVWAMWDRFRKKKDSKGWTDDAMTLSIRDLGNLRDAGFDPKAVVEQSVQRGWTGLFPLKNAPGKQAGTGKFNPVEYMNRPAQGSKDDEYRTVDLDDDDVRVA